MFVWAATRAALIEKVTVPAKIQRRRSVLTAAPTTFVNA